MKKITNLKNRLLLILSGIAIGIINGFFGGGGGMICVPLLEKLLKIEEKKAHSTALAVMLPLSAVSAAVYLVKIRQDWFMFGFVSAGFIAGGVLGAMLLKNLSNKLVRIIFAVVVLAAGVRMII